jgi:hypothetical protein
MREAEQEPKLVSTAANEQEHEFISKSKQQAEAANTEQSKSTSSD